MSATERLIAYHMSRLSDKNAQVRLKSIEELVLLGATEAFTTLEQLFRTDPDEEVRKAAQRGGRELYQKMNKP
jgi:HEAT repeat protein